jgi:hypothetical protein
VEVDAALARGGESPVPPPQRQRYGRHSTLRRDAAPASGGTRAGQTRRGGVERAAAEIRRRRCDCAGGNNSLHLEAVQRAWLAVKRAGGGAGMDGVTIAQFEANLTRELRELQRLLASGEYRPKPVRQVWVPKARGGLRPLALWALRDRVAQRVVYDSAGAGVRAALPAVQLSAFARGWACKMRWRRCSGSATRGCAGWWTPTSRIAFGAIPTERLLALIGAPRPRPAAAALCARLAGGRHHEQRGRAAAPGGRQPGQCACRRCWRTSICTKIDVVMMREGLAFLRYADDFRDRLPAPARGGGGAALQRAGAARLGAAAERAQVAHRAPGSRAGLAGLLSLWGTRVMRCETCLEKVFLRREVGGGFLRVIRGFVWALSGLEFPYFTVLPHASCVMA